MLETVDELADKTSMRTACKMMGVPRSSVYRLKRPKPAKAGTWPH